MSLIRLILEEIRFRKTGFAMSLFAITVAATLFVSGPSLISGYGRETEQYLGEMEARLEADRKEFWKETSRILRDLGFNLLIVHRDTDMADFWSDDYSTVDMPEDYVERLAGARSLTLVTHIVATLQQKIEWRGRKALLKGYAPEATQTHLRKKSPMGYDIPRGHILVGHDLRGELAAGGQVEVLGRLFTVDEIWEERGSKEDITIAMHLDDAQEILDKEGKVNQILALGCRCAGERLPQIREQLEKVLPQTRITEFRTQAIARAKQRDLVEEESEKLLAQEKEERERILAIIRSLDAVLSPIVILACAVWIGLLALANVRERRAEIGILRALGAGTSPIAGLFLGRALLTGALGGLLGFALGTFSARFIGVRALGAEPESFSSDSSILALAVIGAPLICGLASYLPTLSAVLQDPAEVLRDD